MKPLILKGHTRPLTCVKYNNEGDLLFTTAKDSSTTVWFTDTGERLGTLTENGHKGTVWWIDVDKDSRFALTGGGDGTVKLWDIKTGFCIKTWEQSGPVRVVEFCEGSDSFLSVSDPFTTIPSTLRVYSVQDIPKQDVGYEHVVSGDKPLSEWTIEGLSQTEKIYVASWSALNETIITGDTIGTLRIHNPATGKVLRKLEAHVGRINCLSWNKAKSLFVTGGVDCKALLIDVEQFSVLKIYESNTPVNATAISPIKEHVLVAGGQDAMNVTTTSNEVGKFETKFFHLVFQEMWGTVKGHFGPVNALAMHPDGTGFVSGSEDGYVRLHKFDQEYFLMHSEYNDLTALEELAKGN